MASRIVPQNLPQTEHSADPNALPAFLSDLLAAVREQVTEPPTHTRHTSETYALVSSAARVATKGIRQDMRFRALLARLDALGMAWAGDALYRIAHDPARGEALATQLVSALEQAEPTRRVRLMGCLLYTSRGAGGRAGAARRGVAVAFC